MADMEKQGPVNDSENTTRVKDAKKVSFAPFLKDSPSEKEFEELEAAFRVFDSDLSGTIDPGKLGSVMKSLGQNPTEAEVQDLIAAIDEDGTGTINFEEFKHMMIPKLREPENPEDIRECFKVFDRDGNGVITLDDIDTLFSKLGQNFSRQELQDMLRAADFDGDKRVTFEDFLEVLKDP